MVAGKCDSVTFLGTVKMEGNRGYVCMYMMVRRAFVCLVKIGNGEPQFLFWKLTKIQISLCI
ncbi:hypothetical protein Hanom_Chr03g00276921 [Helianthus anomalus]